MCDMCCCDLCVYGVRVCVTILCMRLCCTLAVKGRATNPSYLVVSLGSAGVQLANQSGSYFKIVGDTLGQE